MGEYHKKINNYNNYGLAKYLLIEQIGVILGVEDKDSRLFKVGYDYLFNGNKNRDDYEYLVNTIFNHNYDEWCRKVLLKGESENE